MHFNDKQKRRRILRNETCAQKITRVSGTAYQNVYTSIYVLARLCCFSRLLPLPTRSLYLFCLCVKIFFFSRSLKVVEKIAGTNKRYEIIQGVANEPFCSSSLSLNKYIYTYKFFFFKTNVNQIYRATVFFLKKKKKNFKFCIKIKEVKVYLKFQEITLILSNLGTRYF